MTLVGSTGSPANAARVAAIPLPSRGATGEQPVTVGDGYAFGRIDSLDFIPAAKRAAVFTARTGSDVTTELQAMIDYCKTNRRNGLIRAGYYIISSPLVFTSVALEGISIRGEGHGYAVSGGTGGVTSETILDASSILTKPALVIQFARGLHLSDFGILGPNTAPIGLSEPSNTAADYLSAGVRDSRYSPQCAIAIDPTTGSDPGGGAGYPGMTYTGAGGGGSASILLERITMRNHNVGLLVTPTVAGAQGDFIIARDINVFGAHIAHSIGQSQANVNSLENWNVGSVRRFSDTVTYGQRTGAPPQIKGGQLGGAWSIFAWSDSVKDGSITDLFCEGVAYLGCWGTGGNNSKQALTLVNVGLHPISVWKKAPCFIENYGPVVMIGGSVAPGETEGQPILNAGGDGSLRMIAVAVRHTNPLAPVLPCALSLNKAVTMDAVRLQNSAANFTISDVLPPFGTAPNRVVASPGLRGMKKSGVDYLYTPASATNFYSAFSCSSYAFDLTAKTVAFDCTVPQDVCVGDIAFFQLLVVAPSATAQYLPVLEVATIVSNRITCNMLCDPALFDQTYGPTSLPLYTPEWAPGNACTGSVTSGSTSITSVSPTSTFRNGDRIKGVGIHAQARVVSGGGTSTLVMNRAATASNTGVNLYYGRFVPANVPMAPITLVDGATISAPDLYVSKAFKVTLAGDRTMPAPVNPTDGEEWTLSITQDATGTRLVSSWNAVFRFSGGTAPTLTTTAAKTDRLTFRYDATAVKHDLVRSVLNF